MKLATAKSYYAMAKHWQQKAAAASEADAIDCLVVAQEWEKLAKAIAEREAEEHRSGS